MRALGKVTPTAEQLAIVSRNRPGVEVIRGAAGSGKTTTALLRLRSLVGMADSRRARLQSDEPIRVLILTFNRTLRGYIHTLAKAQIVNFDNIDLNISTFASWAVNEIGGAKIIDENIREQKIKDLGRNINLPDDFLLEEVEYVMSRFLPGQLDDYLGARRDGRGVVPRVERPVREAILNDIIKPYQAWIDDNQLWDWNDLAIYLAKNKLEKKYDIIIVDETQDFSANQIRAINNQLAENHSLTFIVDTAQRIYARGFTWQEAGIVVRPENSRRLERNYRNTVEIARFVAPLINGIPIDDDATIPDFTKCLHHGPVPLVVKGRFSRQIYFVLKYIKDNVDLSTESVALLHPRGGGWFSYLRKMLEEEGLKYIEITRKSDWPDEVGNIALSTLHSSKGLEFDHVIIIGLNAECMPHGDEEGDDRQIMLRRLLAMGIGRAKKSIILGCKPGSEATLFGLLSPETYESVEV